MSVPPRTNMTLTINYCTGLNNISQKDIPHNSQDYDAVQLGFESAQAELLNAYANAAAHGCRKIDSSFRHVKQKEKKFEQARLMMENIYSEDSTSTNMLPNPFLLVSFDEDNEDVDPLILTRSLRATTSPLWKERFDQIPLEVSIAYKRARHAYKNNCGEYTPSSLVFSIYHDDAMLNDARGSPQPGNSCWKRSTPNRTLLLGTARWSFQDISRCIGEPEFEKEFALIDPRSGRIMRDAILNIKVQLDAPRIIHCKQVRFFTNQCQTEHRSGCKCNTRHLYESGCLESSNSRDRSRNCCRSCRCHRSRWCT